MSTYLSLHYHLVFSTKRREPTIDPIWQPRLHEYLGGTITGLGGFPQGSGGIADHVHLLVGLKATHCLADVMRELKKASSTWVHNEICLSTFEWQTGYAAFTVSPQRERNSKHTSITRKSITEQRILVTSYSKCSQPPELNTKLNILNDSQSLRTLRVRKCTGVHNFRGCRCAQPPANRCEASGFDE
jgi:REP element-mobilizing transposase RayT